MKKPTLFKPREKFLVLAIGPAGTDGLFLSVDEDRNIIFEKLARNLDLKKFFASPMRSVAQKSWEGAYLFKSHRKVIAVADSSLATTIPIPLDLAREHGTEKSEIVLPELENMIAQAMGKIFNQCRAEAAARLRIHELDTIMVGAKARNFTVDGNLVVNPVGFTGKKISLLLELTFTGRDLFRDLRQFFNAPDDFFFAESAQARLASLARARKLPLNLIVDEGPRGAALFVLQKTKDGHPVLYRERLQWNFGLLFLRIAAELGVSEGAAKEMYRSYLAGAMSESVARAFKRIIDPVTEQFLKEVGKGKLKGHVYMDAEHELPFALPYKHGGASFDRFPMEEILTQLGFAERQGSYGSDAALSRHLLPFLEAYFDKSNSEINRKLRRRLHWLAD
ncbi:MAG TPA: hypothetical protein VMA75_03565 [Candidatus Paceibacterota bacterium]|nr:hypothetical protein [Candidatus Paceibacterota bacterium]